MIGCDTPHKAPIVQVLEVIQDILAKVTARIGALPLPPELIRCGCPGASALKACLHSRQQYVSRMSFVFTAECVLDAAWTMCPARQASLRSTAATAHAATMLRSPCSH